jgi:hypothetical protein
MYKCMYIQYVQGLCQSRLSTADHVLLLIAPAIYTVHSMSGFALSYTTNMIIPMILLDFCLLPAQFCYMIVYIRNVENRVQIADRCATWNISSGAENLVLWALQF